MSVLSANIKFTIIWPYYADVDFFFGSVADVDFDSWPWRILSKRGHRLFNRVYKMYANWAPKDTKAHAVAGYCISLEPSFSRREAHVDSAPSTARFRWQPPIRERAPRTLKPTVLIFSAAASAPPRSRRISLHFSLSVALSSGSSFCYILLQGLFDLFFMKFCSCFSAGRFITFWFFFRSRFEY